MDLIETLTNGGPVLVIVAHPDDEILGCYGLLCRLLATGHPVSIRIVHNGNQQRYETSSMLATQMGAHCSRSHDDIFNSELSESRTMISTLDTWLKECAPELIITHGVYLGDHHEHRLVGNAVTTSWQRYRADGKKQTRLIRIAPFPTGLGFIPTTFTNIADVLPKKASALGSMNAVLNRPYLDPSLHDRLAIDLGDRYFATTNFPVEVFEEELRPGISPLLSATAQKEQHATSLMVTTPLPTARASSSADALKLVAEEYRVCTARADELQRLVWQVFVGVGAITSILGAAMARMADDGHSLSGALTVLFVCLIGNYFLAQWAKISSKWSAQMRAFYERIDSLEKHLHFRTNSQTRRVDESTEAKKGFYIGALRNRLGIVLALWWAFIGGRAVYAIVNLQETPLVRLFAFPAAVGIAVLLLFFYWLAARNPYTKSNKSNA